jgi:hypothetical protein
MPSDIKMMHLRRKSASFTSQSISAAPRLTPPLTKSCMLLILKLDLSIGDALCEKFWAKRSSQQIYNKMAATMALCLLARFLRTPRSNAEQKNNTLHYMYFRK